jgi:pantoate--beta-alanine ligase
MVRDLLLSHPLPGNLHIVPTSRDPNTGLALSSRNAYLTHDERAFAPTLYKALKTVELSWNSGATKEACTLEALSIIQHAADAAAAKGIDVRADYIEMNDSDSFEVLEPSTTRSSPAGAAHPVIVSGAMWVGRTRLIDNVLLNENGRILLRR